MTTINTSSIYRITGLASGLDIDQMVTDLMKAHRAPLDKLMQKKQIWQWKQEDYRTINTSLLNLRNEVFNLKLQGTFQVKKAASSDESIVTATAGATAAATTYQVKVNQLATVATNSSLTPLRPGIVGTTSLNATLGTPLNITTNNNQFKLAYGGTTVDIILDVKSYDGTAGKTLNDLVADIQAKIDAAIGKGKVMVSLTADKRLKLTPMVASDGTTVPALAVPSGTALDILGLTGGQLSVPDQTALDPNAPLASQVSKFANSFGWGTDHIFSFTINGQTFNFDGDTDSLNKVIATVNANKAAGVSMFYDASTDKIAISTIKTGDNQAGAEIQVKDVTGSFMTGVLQINEANEKGGTDASFEINGLAGMTSHTNSYTVNGVTFNFKGADANKYVTVTVSNDIDAVVNTIKNFVNKYNDIIASINAELKEERYPDYLPLTDEQIQEGKLTDKQIDQWQEKARSGLLKGDPLLSSAVSSIRAVMSSIVQGVTGQVTVTAGTQKITTVANSLSVIGITTGTWEEEGKLYLDETRLREALQSNPDAVMELFTRTTDAAGNPITDSKQKGLAVQLYDAINNAMSRITSQAGSAGSLYDQSYISRMIRDMDRQISDMEKRLQDLEDRYYRQFTAMEQAIAQMNTQSMWLAQQFAGGGGQ
ncbi:MAG TPA: flagellar filament capping protein FliD [Syntrophomonadaceae bacterium]|nr:flagellar filament capping protein FliD [Syntrophomonadaceae bacterium]